MNDQFLTVGKSLPRIDAQVKATGEALYCSDLTLPRMLYGKILPSPLPHARIVNIDVSRARRLTGVKEIITGKDTLGLTYGRLPHIPITMDEPGLATDKVRYIGDDVAAVAAVDEEIAQEALGLIKVDYEELAALYDPICAMAPDAVKIHEVDRNIAWQVDCVYGDLEEGFRQSDHVREDEFESQSVIHCSLETRAALARYESSGKLTVWSSCQSPYYLKKDLAKLLGMTEGNVRVISPFVGGGFGGKRDLYAADFCAALLAKRTGQPVKICYTRNEEFASSRRRHAMVIKLKTGVKRDGRIMAQKASIIGDGGAYNSMGPVIIGRAGAHLTMQYKLPNFECHCYLVYTNKPVAGAFRGFGFLQACFANESQLDLIAADLGLDPIELRLKNALEAGYSHPLDFEIGSCGLKESLRIVADSPIWKTKGKGGEGRKRRGVGAAACSYICGTMGMPTAAALELHTDGTVKLIAGGVEIGQGSQTTLCQIAAEELGVAMEDIKLAGVDTDVTPIDLGSFASRTTLYAGNAVRAAAQDAKRQLFGPVAEKLEASPQDLECRHRRVYVKGSPDKGLSFAEAVRACMYSRAGMPIMGRGYYNPRVTTFDHRSLKGNVSPAYSYGAMACQVEVDSETGQIKVIHSWNAHDCGRAINPMGLSGQVEGSVGIGIGQALYEDFFFADGQTLNGSLDIYRVPTAIETPGVDTALVESIEPNGPFGAKGVSEGTQLPVAPAIANALYDALGVRVKKLPLTPHQVLKALEETKR
ncbi:MAG: molybdopterin cofactor-binding domain-containing protein [Thermodesulfobacteriota bacterium]